MSKEVSVEAEQPPAKDYSDPPPAPLLDFGEVRLWSFYRALIAEFVATLLFLYVSIATVIGHKEQNAADQCSGVGLLGIAWAFGGMIFILVYCTAGISGGHINPAVTFGLFLARKVSLIRAVLYIVAQCLGGIVGVGIVKGIMKHQYNSLGGGANVVAAGYSKGTALGAEIIGTFVLVYTVFSATDPKRSARDSHVPVLAPLPIGFAVFMVHLATIPITGTGINPARSLGAAVIYNQDKAWDDHVSLQIDGLHEFLHLCGCFGRRMTVFFFLMVHSVDLLGGSVDRSVGRRGVPPVHPESSRHQGSGLLQKQPQQLSSLITACSGRSPRYPLCFPVSFGRTTIRVVLGGMVGIYVGLPSEAFAQRSHGHFVCLLIPTGGGGACNMATSFQSVMSSHCSFRIDDHCCFFGRLLAVVQ
ncbi:hypothetical protein BHE74_00016580 [Ensete ventricosum]|nr:hypothetical protein BHE74_00016580 [Ensete ventricosum]